MGDPTPLIILSFCDIQTTLLISLTSIYWKNKVELFWSQTKILVVYSHVHALKHKKESIQWISKYCRNLRVIDIRWCAFPISLVVTLIHISPLLEVYLSSYGEVTVFEAIYEMCPHIKGLGILHGDIPVQSLSKFKSLTALELGNYTTFLNIARTDLLGILSRNPALQIVHILGFPDSFTLLEALRPGQLKSFSVPYEQNPITIDKIEMLKRFTHLDNINFGQSTYLDAFQVLQVLARNYPNIQSLSFYPDDTQSDLRILSLISNGSFFPRLEKLGCRIKPSTRTAYAHFAQTRKKIVLYDYEQERTTPHNWCYSSFDLWFLMKKYGAHGHTQW